MKAGSYLIFAVNHFSSSGGIIKKIFGFYSHVFRKCVGKCTAGSENLRLAKINEVEKEISGEVDHYRLVLKKYKKVQKVIHVAAISLGGLTTLLSSGTIAASLTGVGVVVGAPIEGVAACLALLPLY